MPAPASGSSSANVADQSEDPVGKHQLTPTSSSTSSLGTAANVASPRRGHKRMSSTASASIADSPLQQMNVESTAHFKLKVVSIYERLFNGEPHRPGYWIEFFLLPVNKAELATVIQSAAPLGRHEETVQTLVSAAIANIGPGLPHDIVINALGVLEVVFCEVLELSTKSAATPLIQVLAGINRAGQVFDELTANLLSLLRHKSLRVVEAASHTILAISRKCMGTPLSTLFSTKNFFAAFIHVIDRYFEHDVSAEAFAAIGVLTALNIYDDDGASVYLQRISDYIDEAVMAKIIALSQRELANVPEVTHSYRHDHHHENNGASSGGLTGWFSSWLSRSPAPADPASFDQTDNGWKVLLPLHLFVSHNSIFAQSFASSPALVTLITSSVPIFEHAQKSTQRFSRTWLLLLIFRRLVDTEFLVLIDPAVATIIRVEVPKLALDTSRRVPVAGILDLTQIGLRSVGGSKNPDLQLLQQLAVMLNQICSQTAAAKIIWHYNWPRLWKTVLGLIKHLSARQLSEDTVEKLLNSVVGMSLHRDALDEEDWTFLMYSIVQNAHLIDETVKQFPALENSLAIRTAKAMIAQYELKKDNPDLPSVVKQGKQTAGRITALVGEKHRPFSVLSEPIVKRVVKSQIK